MENQVYCKLGAYVTEISWLYVYHFIGVLELKLSQIKDNFLQGICYVENKR